MGVCKVIDFLNNFLFIYLFIYCSLQILIAYDGWRVSVSESDRRGNDVFPKFFGKGISVCIEEAKDIPASPKIREEKSYEPRIFTSVDTMWVVNEEMV